MRPSGVRSKRAPQASSSLTRAGASSAWILAMRQSFRSFPPRMVSRKWTFQLSRESVVASAAATPPSAITVCALPSSDLQMSATEQPWAAASIAARRVAPASRRAAREAVEVTADQVAGGVTGEAVARQRDRAHEEDQRPEAETVG